MPQDAIWMVMCGAAVLLLRVGMTLYATGAVRAKNAAGTAMRSLTDVCLAVLVFWAVGLAVLNPPAGDPAASYVVLGVNLKFFFGLPRSLSIFQAVFFFYLVLASIGPAIVVGSLAERCRFVPSLASSIMMGALLIPICGHWAWFGWLADLGYRDLGGASVLHVSGAVVAAIGAIVVGARTGKYNHDGSTNAIPGHSAPMISLGVMLMLIAWPAYLIGGAGGADAGVIGMNVILAAAAAGLTGILYSNWRYNKPDVHVMFACVVGGLVAVSAGAGFFAGWQAVIIGGAAGLLIPWFNGLVELVWKIDDPGGGIAIHGGGGAWGILAAGIFAHNPFSLSAVKTIGVQLLGLAVIAAVAAALGLGLFALLKATVRMRVRDGDEYDGLDLVEHEAGAYPDFHQSMIKSY